MVRIENLSKKEIQRVREDLIDVISVGMYFNLKDNGNFEPTKNDLESAYSEVIKEHHNIFYAMEIGRFNFSDFVDNILDTVRKEKIFFNKIDRRVKQELAKAKRFNKK